jgi:adenylate cyclase
MSFWGELRRRNVVKVVIAYAIVGWILVQVAATFFPALNLPAWTITLVAALVILGFPIAVILSWAYELTPAGIVRTPGLPASGGAVAARPVAPDTATDSGARHAERGIVADAHTANLGPASSFLENSVAVLPLDNLSPDPDNAYFAAGLHEEILNQLAKLGGLNVISRTSVLRYANDRPAIADIAKALNVQSVMEGSIRYAGNRIRVTAQLIDSTTGAHLWSETYEREFDDIFAIESDIAINVAKALEAELSHEEQRAVAAAPTISTKAYRVYLRARSIGMTDIGTSLRFCDEALEIDPRFALAHMSKGSLYAISVVNNIGQTDVDEDERLSRFEELARYHSDRALELDPTLEASRLAHALIDTYSWHWTRAMAAIDRVDIKDADDLGPQFPVWIRAYSGDKAGSIALARRAVELGPNDWRPRFALASALDYAADYAAALAEQRAAITVNPTLPLLGCWLAYIHVALGQNAEALAALVKTEELMGDSRDLVTLPEIAYSYSRIGRMDDVERLYSEFERRIGDHDPGAGIWAMTYLAIGDEERAEQSIRTAIDRAGRHEIDQGFWPLMNIKMNATADPLLETPRFVELRERIRGD